MSISNNVAVQAPQTFSQMLENLGENASDNYIYLQKGVVEQEGDFGHLFTRTKVNIATTQALQAEVRARFGDDVADALKPRFETFIRAGKQMKVSDARELLADAKLTQTFQNYGKDLETRYGHTVASYLKPTLDAMTAAGNSLEVARATLEVAAQGMVDDLGKLEAKIDSFADGHAKWSEPDKADFKAAMRAGLEMHPDLLETKTDSEGLTPFDQFQDNVAMILDGTEGSDSVFSTVKDPTTRRELMTLAATWLGPSPSLHCLALEKLPQMRALQPTGTISAKTVFSTLFASDVPSSFNVLGEKEGKSALQHVFRNKVLQESRFHDARDEWNTTHNFMTNGVPYADALKRAGEIESGDFKLQSVDFSRIAFETNLAFKNPTEYTVERAESQFFGSEAAQGDFHRMRARDTSKASRTSQFTLHDVGEETKTISNAGDPEQKNAAAATLKESLKAVCAGNPEQYRVLLWALTQATPLQNAARGLSQYVGVAMNEHMPLNVDMRRDSNGDILLAMDLPEGFGVKLAASYVIHPDGTSDVTRFEFGPQD